MVKFLSDRGFHRTDRFCLRWRSWLFITIPVLFSPILILHHFEKQACCAYSMLIVIFYWICDVLPLPGTGLLPVLLFPLMNVASPNLISLAYMKDVNMLLFGGLACAVAIEYSDLHSRIALRFLSFFGTTPRCLLAAFLFPTVLLSMWINNTTATAMMVPVADAVLRELFPADKSPTPQETPASDSRSVSMQDKDIENRVPDHLKESADLRYGLMLTICYAATIGGTGTLIGTGCNLVMVAALDIEYPNRDIKISYFNWMCFAVPNMILCCFALWFLMQIFCLGCKGAFKKNKILTDEQMGLKDSLKTKYQELGPMSYHQKMVIIVFVILIVCWISREPGYFPGWGELIFPDYYVSDSAPTVLLVVLLFVLPEFYDKWWTNIDDRALDTPPPSALTWRAVHARTGWGILFLLGGGYAMASACRESGLCLTISKSLQVFEDVPAPVLCLCTMIMACLMTQITSNSATAVTLAPLVIALADGVKVHPSYLLLPVIICCSFAFTFPFSTPPNYVAFLRAKCGLKRMFITGACLTTICVIITFIMANTLAPLVFDMSHSLRNRTI